MDYQQYDLHFTQRGMTPVSPRGMEFVHYEIAIEATDRSLSPEGYIFNNERIGAYFDSRFGENAEPWDAVFCENMALTAANELAQIMLNEGIDVQCVECQILGSNGAKIRAIWTPNLHIGGNLHDTISQTVTG